MTKNESRTVWSSEQGDLRKQQASLPKGQSLPVSQQTVYLHRDSKGRGEKPSRWSRSSFFLRTK